MPGGMVEEQRARLREMVRRNGGRRVYYCADIRQVKELFPFIYADPVSLDQAVKVAEEEETGNVEDTENPPANFAVTVSDNALPGTFADFAQIFSDRKNPYYDPKNRTDDLTERSLQFIMSSRLQDDVAKYIQDHKMLPRAELAVSQGKRVGRRIIQDNLRFLFGFYRVDLD